MTIQDLSNLINGLTGISPDMALRLEKAFGASSETWLALQQRYDLSQAEQQVDLSNVRTFTDDIRLPEYLDKRGSLILARLFHEILSTSVAIRDTIELMRQDILRKRYNVLEIFRHDYLDCISSWCDIMFSMIDNYNYCSNYTHIQPLLVNFPQDVIEPAIQRTKILLRRYMFSEESISYSNFGDFPPLWIDKYKFQHAISNLLSNSIRYADRSHDRLQIEILEGKEPNKLLILFRDWGIGVDPSLSEAIFKEGFRGP